MWEFKENNTISVYSVHCRLLPLLCGTHFAYFWVELNYYDFTSEAEGCAIQPNLRMGKLRRETVDHFPKVTQISLGTSRRSFLCSNCKACALTCCVQYTVCNYTYRNNQWEKKRGTWIWHCLTKYVAYGFMYKNQLLIWKLVMVWVSFALRLDVCVCTKSLQSCLTLCNPTDHIALQVPLSMEFSRQEY